MITQKISYLSFGKGKGLMTKLDKGLMTKLDNELLAKENKRKKINSKKMDESRMKQ